MGTEARRQRSGAEEKRSGRSTSAGGCMTVECMYIGTWYYEDKGSIRDGEGKDVVDDLGAELLGSTAE